MEEERGTTFRARLTAESELEQSQPEQVLDGTMELPDAESSPSPVGKCGSEIMSEDEEEQGEVLDLSLGRLQEPEVPLPPETETSEEVEEGDQEEDVSEEDSAQVAEELSAEEDDFREIFIAQSAEKDDVREKQDEEECEPEVMSEGEEKCGLDEDREPDVMHGEPGVAEGEEWEPAVTQDKDRKPEVARKDGGEDECVLMDAQPSEEVGFAIQGDIESALEPRSGVPELPETELVSSEVEQVLPEVELVLPEVELASELVPPVHPETEITQSGAGQDEGVEEMLDLLNDVTGGQEMADDFREQESKEEDGLQPAAARYSTGLTATPRWASPLSMAVDGTGPDYGKELPESGSCRSPRLEETVRAEDASRSVSAQIRQIVTKHLSTEDLTEVGTSKQNLRLMQDENMELQRELERMEDLLAATRAEREEILIKYNALGERMDHFLKQRDAADGSFLEEESAFKSVLGQNLDLRKRLEEQYSNFQKKLKAFSDGQEQQTQLVQRLQSKVIQYRQKCDDLESGARARQIQLDQSRFATPEASGFPGISGGGDAEDEYDSEQPVITDTGDEDFDTTLIRLEQERNRCSNLIHVNTLLREQLEAATQANQSLAADVNKVTQDWSAMREELESKEAEWREEEQSFNDYFMEEHNRLMKLWKDAISFRREFGDMKSSTQQDLAKLRNEFNKMASELRKACQTAYHHSDSNLRDAEKDLGVTIGPYEAVHGDSADTMNPTELWHRIQDLGRAQTEALAERSEMLARIEDLKSQSDQLRLTLVEKEKTINAMSASLQEMEFSHQQVSSVTTLREERDTLLSTLKDLATQFSRGGDQDQDKDDGDGATLNPDLSGLSELVASRGTILGGSALSSTIATIQSALNHREVQIEELSIKLSSSRDQLNTYRNQFEECIEHKRQSEQQIQQLKMQLESCHREKIEKSRDMDRLKVKFDGLNEDKLQLDGIKQGLVDQIALINSENEKIRRELTEIDHSRQGLDDEKEILVLEKEKQQREIEICQKTISTLEVRLTSVKDELIQCKEILTKTGLKKDIAKQEKSDLEETLKQAEKRCRSMEVEVAKSKAAESNLRDLLTKLHGDSEALGHERAELNMYAKKLSEDKAHLTGEIAEMEQEKAGLKEELLRLEQEKITLVEDGESVQDALATAERINVALQAEADRHAREKRELGSQLTLEIRKNSSLAEEVVHLTRDVEHRRQAAGAAVKEKEYVAKERADALIRLEAAEREMRSLAETVSALRIDKGNLEMLLYDSQQEIALLSAKRSQLELEKNDLIDKRQLQQAQINDVQRELESEKHKKESMKNALEQRLLQASKEQSSTLERNKQQHQEITEKFIKEKETIKQRLEMLHTEVVQKMIAESGQHSAKQKAKMDALQKDLEMHQRDFQEKWTNSERDKERLKEAHRKEKAKLLDQQQNLHKELQAMQSNAERDKRETSSRSDQEKAIILDLQTQLRSLRIQMEDAELTHEKALKDLRNQVQELQNHKNSSQQEMETIRGKLHITEEAKENLRKELSETMRKLKHGGEQTLTFQNEVAEVRRQVADEIHERSALQKSNEEFCSSLKRSEIEKAELKRNLEECYQKISVMEAFGLTSSNEIEQLRRTLQEVERSRLEFRREAYTLRKDLKNLEESLLQKTQEISDLQGKVGREEDKDEFNKKEIQSLRQKLSECEASRDGFRKDLNSAQRKLTESMDVSSLKERDLRMALDASRKNEGKLDERKRQLELLLATATSQCDDLKLQLSIADGKVGALDSQLLKLEASKKTVEQKLTSVYSSLRRYVGVRLDTSDVSTPFHSPIKRRPSPRRGADADTTEPRRRLAFLDRIQSAADVDPDLIRDSLKDVMQQLSGLEKEKEDANVQVRNMKEQLIEGQNDRELLLAKLCRLENSLGATHQDNQKTLSQLSSAQKNVLAQQEAIARLQKENNSLSTNVDNQEHRIKQLETDKNQNLAKITKFVQNESRSEKETVLLRTSLTEIEGRFSKSDQTRRSQETELQRLRISLTDKDTERQVLQDRCETMNRHVQELEDKCASFQLTVERLNLSLERSASDESELKGKLQTLNRSLTESTSSGWTLQEKIQNLQKALANCENERRASQERLESTKQSLNESKKSNLALGERMQQLRQEITNAEDRNKDLEREMRSSEKLITHHRDGDQENMLQIQRLQQEKHALQSTVAELQRTLAQLEVEKHDFQRWHVLLEKDKSALKQTLDKVERERLMTSEFASRTNRERSYLDSTLGALEKENRDLQTHLQTLEVQSTDREKNHSQQLLNLTTRHRQEKDIEIERLKNAKVQAERTLELRERAHRQRVLGLEQQIQMLRDQLNQEIRKRQMFIQKSAQTGVDIKDLHEALDKSLKNVSQDNTLNALLLERETRMLDTAMDRHLSVSERLSPSYRERSRTVSPRRSATTSTPIPRSLLLPSKSKGLTDSLKRL